jgi:hypothetical protein
MQSAIGYLRVSTQETLASENYGLAHVGNNSREGAAPSSRPVSWQLPSGQVLRVNMSALICE